MMSKKDKCIFLIILLIIITIFCSGNSVFTNSQESPKPECNLICYHGGQCKLDSEGSESCLCPKNFLGKQCEKIPSNRVARDIKNEVPSPKIREFNVKRTPTCDLDCYNGGTCQITSLNVSYCICVMGFYGEQCRGYDPDHVDLNMITTTSVYENLRSTEPKTESNGPSNNFKAIILGSITGFFVVLLIIVLYKYIYNMKKLKKSGSKRNYSKVPIYRGPELDDLQKTELKI